ncbi:LOW QUALITY PROTEIN: taste receptor type 2 member 60 [Dugong dugon]
MDLALTLCWGLAMLEKRAIVLAGILFFLCLVAVAGNDFIFAALGIEWLLRKKLSPCGKLLVSLGASRFCLQWVVIEKSIYLFLYPRAFPYNHMIQFITFQQDFFNAVTLWFSTCLSVFCVKIATFLHSAFLWLKQKASRWVLWMLLSSVWISSLSTILFFIGNQCLYQNHLLRDLHSGNNTGNGMRRFYEKFYFFLLKMVIWMPTIVFLVGMVLLITSLGKHAKKTLLIVSGCWDTRAQAHFKALLVLISFAVLFISYFLSLVLNSVGVFPFQELQYWMWQVVIYVCMAVHPIILLLSKPRLRAYCRGGATQRLGHRE